MNKPVIRLIEPKDNSHVKQLVQETLAEFGLVGEGFAGVDEELNDMHAAYADELSAYYVITLEGQVMGVGGYAPLAGTEPGTIAELRKMYFRPALRGQGLGQKMIELCINGARAKGYNSIYLETVEAMKVAQVLYQNNGFEYVSCAMGNTGHTGCGVRMMKALDE